MPLRCARTRIGILTPLCTARRQRRALLQQLLLLWQLRLHHSLHCPPRRRRLWMMVLRPTPLLRALHVQQQRHVRRLYLRPHRQLRLSGQCLWLRDLRQLLRPDLLPWSLPLMTR